MIKNLQFGDEEKLVIIKNKGMCGLPDFWTDDPDIFFNGFFSMVRKTYPFGEVHLFSLGAACYLLL